MSSIFAVSGIERLRIICSLEFGSIVKGSSNFMLVFEMAKYFNHDELLFMSIIGLPLLSAFSKGISLTTICFWVSELFSTVKALVIALPGLI